MTRSIARAGKGKMEKMVGIWHRGAGERGGRQAMIDSAASSKGTNNLKLG